MALTMHHFNPDGDGDCKGCPLPRGHRVHHSPPRSRPATSHHVAVSANSTATSVAAADRAARTTMPVRHAVLASLANVDPARGLTDKELLDAPLLAGRNPNTVRPRRIDLVRDDLVRPARDGNGRPVLREGSQAWTLTPTGRAQSFKPSPLAAVS